MKKSEARKLEKHGYHFIGFVEDRICFQKEIPKHEEQISETEWKITPRKFCEIQAIEEDIKNGHLDEMLKNNITRPIKN